MRNIWVYLLVGRNKNGVFSYLKNRALEEGARLD